MRFVIGKKTLERLVERLDERFFGPLCALTARKSLVNFGTALLCFDTAFAGKEGAEYAMMAVSP